MCDICSYPKEILPDSSYKKTINIDDIINDGIELCLTRRSSVSPCEYTIGGKRFLKEDALTKDALNYSLNLMGGKFKKDHVPWRQKKEANNDWDGSDVDLSNYKDMVEYIHSCDIIYFKSSQIHNIPIPYLRSVDNDKELGKYEENITKLGKTIKEVWNESSKEIEIYGTILLKHEPTMLNYWHVIIAAYSAENPPKKVDDTKGKWKKSLNAAILMLLKGNYLSSSPEISSIPECYYKK